MKKQLLLALFIVAGLAAVLAFKQEHTPKKYLTLTIYHNSWITIVDEYGTSETKELKAMKTSKSYNWIESNQTPLTAKLNELGAKGYKMVGVSPIIDEDDGEGYNNTTYVFEKE